VAFLLCPFFSYLPPAIFSSVKLIFGLDFLFAGFLFDGSIIKGKPHRNVTSYKLFLDNSVLNVISL